MKYLIPILLLFCAGCIGSKPVFKLVTSDSKPLTNHKVVVYNGDDRFKIAKGTNPYPYKGGDQYPWFLTELKTDDSGLLTLDGNYGRHSLNLVFGDDYKSQSISFSSDLSHTFSRNHVRIVAFTPKSRLVQGNYIYNLNNHKVTFIERNGDRKTTSFEYIPLRIVKKSIEKPKK